MLERTVKAAVKKRLDELGAYWFMPVQRGLGGVSLDFLVCYRGRFIGIETKAPGKRITPLQRVTIEAMEAAGGKVFVVDSTEAAKKLKLD